MQTEKINPKMLALAREARGLSQADLAELSGVSRSNISRFELNGINISDEYLDKLILVLKFHPSLYHVDAEIIPSELYRKRDKVAMKLLTKIDANINLYILNLTALIYKMQWQDPKIPLLHLEKDFTANDAASKLRRLWKMPKGVIPDITEVLEENGIITVETDFETDRVDSRSVVIEDKYPVIFYNTRLLGDRLRFSLAYELGHIVMHSREKIKYSQQSAHDANLFAAEFLMPKEDILKDLKGEVNTDVLANLKIKWKVSMHSLLYRANDLGVITDNQKRYIINTFNLFKIRKREPKELDVKIERGRLLRDMITKYRTRQKMSVKQFAAFFHLSEEEFMQRYNKNNT